jgi:hypothetical protein
MKYCEDDILLNQTKYNEMLEWLGPDAVRGKQFYVPSLLIQPKIAVLAGSMSQSATSETLHNAKVCEEDKLGVGLFWTSARPEPRFCRS